MSELILKARRAIRFLFYKDIPIKDQTYISKILNNDELELLFWKMSKADRHHSLEVLNRTYKRTQNEDLLNIKICKKFTFHKPIFLISHVKSSLKN